MRCVARGAAPCGALPEPASQLAVRQGAHRGTQQRSHHQSEHTCRQGHGLLASSSDQAVAMSLASRSVSSSSHAGAAQDASG